MTYTKKSEGKPSLNKIYPKFIEDIAKTLDFGDNKYGLMNWKNYKDINDLTSALFQHYNQFNSGELLDSQSGLSHLAHIASNAMMLMWLIDNDVVEIKDLYYNNKQGIIK